MEESYVDKSRVTLREITKDVATNDCKKSL